MNYLKYNMDSRQLTNLLSFIAANYEVRHSTGARLKPEFTKKLLLILQKLRFVIFLK